MSGDNGHKPSVPLAPHSVDAEEATIGSVLLMPDAIPSLAEFLQADDFFITRNGWAWAAILSVWRRGDAIDYLTVAAELAARGQLDEFGGAVRLTGLINQTPSGIYAETYGRLVQRAALRRRLLVAASDIAKLAQDEERDVMALLDEAQARITQVAAGRTGPRETQPLRAVLSETFDDLERARLTKASGIPTGFDEIDGLLGGLQKSDLIIVAGRPGMGKTSWLLTVAMNAARKGTRVFVASQEMTKRQVGARLLAIQTGISTKRQRTGQVTDAEFSKLTAGIAQLENLPVWVDDVSNLTPEQLRAKVLRTHAQHGVDLIMVDYLQLMRGGGRFENRVQEVTEISRSLKALAKELNVPVVAAAQLNRAVESRADKKPLLSDLKESGSIEQDADVVMFLHRPEYYDPHAAKGECNIILAKQRNGPVGTASLYFDAVLTKFSNLTRQTVDLATF